MIGLVPPRPLVHITASNSFLCLSNTNSFLILSTSNTLIFSNVSFELGLRLSLVIQVWRSFNRNPFLCWISCSKRLLFGVAIPFPISLLVSFTTEVNQTLYRNQNRTTESILIFSSIGSLNRVDIFHTFLTLHTVYPIRG